MLPFSAYRFIQGIWTPGEFLCRMIPFIQYGNIGVSLLCIAMITINRYKLKFRKPPSLIQSIFVVFSTNGMLDIFITLRIDM